VMWPGDDQLEATNPLIATGRSGTVQDEFGTTMFVHTFQPPPRMLVFGAIDFARATARLGTFLGYRVTVCDARPEFATAARSPEADEVVVD
jgi:xanthine dehydrogenase accessory factor